MGVGGWVGGVWQNVTEKRKTFETCYTLNEMFLKHVYMYMYVYTVERVIFVYFVKIFSI